MNGASSSPHPGPRRAAQLRHCRPDLRVESLRGNVETRLRAIREGRVAATFLAAAGLDRLGIEAGVPLPLSIWLPAASQGVVGMTCRQADTGLMSLMARVNDADTFRALSAERAVLEGLGGSCHTPVAVHALAAEAIILRAELLSPAGRAQVCAEVSGQGDPHELGLELARILLDRASPSIRASLEKAGA
jgi:hydroxymethylbilane synthase